MKPYIKRTLELSEDKHSQHTPFDLCDEIWDKLEEQTQLNNKKILVVANLEFLYTLSLRISNMSNVYFATPCELKKKVATKCISLENAFLCTGVLDNEELQNMKFDVIVGNPPYQYEQGNNRTLFHKFYKLATNITVSGGYVGFISPTTWMNSRKKLLTDLKLFLFESGLQSVTIFDPKKVFGNNIALDSCGYTIQHKDHVTNTIPVQRLDGSVIHLTIDKNVIGTSDQIAILEKIQSGTHKMFTQRGRHYNLNKKGTNFDGSVAPNKTNQHSYPMINKINQSGEEIAYVNKTAKVSNTGKWKVMFNYITSQNHLGNIIINNTMFELSHMCVFVVVESEQQGKHLKQFLTSKLFRFVLPLLRPNTTNTVGAFRQITLVDLTRSWTDQELYEHFKLTNEEIQLIEETIK